MNLVLPKKCAWVPILVATVAGCGGGGSSIGGSGGSTSGSGGSGGPIQSTSIGEAQVGYSGTAKPAVLNYENGLTFTSFAGVSVSNFTVIPNQVVSNSTIAYLTQNQTGLMTYQRGTTQIAYESGLQVLEGCAFGHNAHLYTTSYDYTSRGTIARSSCLA